MAWARLDDGFFGHPQTNRIWKQNPGAIGLLVRMISFCAKYETDGYVSQDSVEMLSSVQLDRDAQVAVLIEQGALREHEDGFVVNGYLDYNPSREQIEEKREADRLRKAKQRS